MKRLQGRAGAFDAPTKKEKNCAKMSKHHAYGGDAARCGTLKVDTADRDVTPLSTFSVSRAKQNIFQPQKMKFPSKWVGSQDVVRVD